MVRQLARIFGPSFVILALGKLVTLLAFAAMAREVDSVAFGQVNVAFNVAVLLATVFSFGFQMAGPRLITTYVHEKDWAKLRGFMALGAAILVGASLIVGIGCAVWTLVDDAYDLAIAVLISLIFPPALSSLVRGGILRGLGDVVGSLAPYELLGPVLAVVLFVLFRFETGLGVGLALAMSFLVAEALGFVWLAMKVPAQASGVPRETDFKSWIGLGGVVHAVLIGRLAIQRIDLILISSMLGLEAAGVYAAAQRLAFAVAFAGRITSHVLSPRLALAYNVSPAQVESEVRVALGFSALVGVPMFAIMAIGAPYFLSLFGAGYESAALILIVLSLGQVTNALMAPVNQALLMTSFERFQMALTIIVFALTLIGFLAFIPLYGLLGAASVTTASLIGLNLAAYIFGYIKLRHEMTPAA